MDIKYYYLWFFMNLNAIISPGPDFVFITGMSLKSRRYGFFSSLGITLAIFCHILFIGLGLTNLFLKNYPVLFDVVMVLGMLYLLYISYQMIKGVLLMRQQVKSNVEVDLTKVVAREDLTDWQCFQRGFICNITNVKAVIFLTSIFALLPVQTSTNSIFTETLILGAIVTVINIVYWNSLVLFVNMMAQKFMNPSFKYKLELVCGILMALIVAALAYVFFVVQGH